MNHLRKLIVLALLCLAAPLSGFAAEAPAAAQEFLAWAPTPPMGWNSWDYYGTTLNEEQAKAQADAMAEHLKPFGWEYFTVDIQWYEPSAKGHEYQEGAELTMDEYSRLLPAVEKFPSAADGAGFRPLADYVHGKGLKFGIHLMRGIPRQAVHRNTAILGTDARASDIALTSSTCAWNPDMYGVDMSRPGAQEYYDSLFELYASWGVDFVKVDDIARPYDEVQKAEIEAIRRAIDRSGRPMVLSLSPGDTPLSRGSHVRDHANMWRISDDFWDRWPPLKGMFDRLDRWTPHRRQGAWPDADMLPLGLVEFGRPTRFTKDEQQTVMTLWSIARSPLILGGDMTRLDNFTLSLLTNQDVLAVNQASENNRSFMRTSDGLIGWVADVPGSQDRYLALFNTRDGQAGTQAPVPVRLDELGITGKVHVRDLWAQNSLGYVENTFAPDVPVHGARLFRLKPVGQSDLASESFPVGIAVDASEPVGEMKPIWRFFGADEPNYATMPDGRKLLADMGELKPEQVYFRAHNLMCTGDGTPALKWGSTNMYTEDAEGNPVYDWTIVDEIFDTYLERGVRPFVQLGFMPRALSTNPEPYQHQWRPGLRYSEIITGWAYPPKDYDKWRELIYQWTKHCVERYGREEVEQWYWEVWNEPNGDYWRGTPEEFYKLHDYAIDGVRRALPTARVGGPHTAGAGGDYHRNFLRHCLTGTNYATGETGTPLDFVAFHAKGWPTFEDGHVRLGIANQLRAINEGFALVAGFPELRQTPIVIGESDPDGCAACQGEQLGYRNTTMYSSYTAATFARKYELADRHGVNLEGALTWAFEFEDQPYFAGFRVMASNGLTLPVFNVFRMFSRMSGERIVTTSTQEVALDTMMRDGVRWAPDVDAIASRDGDKICVMVWHYHDDDVPGPAAQVTLDLVGLPAGAERAEVREYRIDDRHSNVFTAWQRMGSPQDPTTAQYAALEEASELQSVGDAQAVAISGGKLDLKLDLPRQGVSLLIVDLNLSEEL